jgi:large subunit ribosomal protein L35
MSSKANFSLKKLRLAFIYFILFFEFYLKYSLPLPSVLKMRVMPKMKTHSGAKKRFKLTSSGKVKRFQANSSHLMRKKTKKAKRNLRGSTLVSPAEESRMKRLLCV